MGNLYSPNDIKFGGETDPPLRPREWLVLLFLQTDKSKLLPNKIKKIKSAICGSRTTFWRTKKKLKKKGYL